MTDYRGQLFGNYRLTRFLGEGGFATVYLGEHIHLHTHSAIKILTTRLINQEVEQFRHEAYLLAHLTHPNIVRVFDFGLEERERLPFLVMQYASHGTLRQRHIKGSIVPLEAILSYVKPVAAALHYAHSNRIIHRDVKPENMLIGDQNEILLSDFGIALLAQSSLQQKTQEMIGTVSYMSPEQIQGKPQAASDQYSLAIVVYEWLCGVCPFKGSFLEVCTQHMMAPPPPLREKVPTISPEVEQVVTRALAKDPKERFSSIQAFATALTEAAEGRARASVSFTSQAESETRSSTPVSFTPNATTEYVRSREGKVDTHYAAQGHRDAFQNTPPYTFQNTPRLPQELSPSRHKKGRKGLIMGIIAAVFVLMLGGTGVFTISNHAYMLAAATAAATNRLATTTAANHLATATAIAARLTSTADFTVQSPALSNMTIVSNDASFDTDHFALSPGQQVVVAFTLQANTRSVSLAIRALVSQASPNNPGFSPISLFCNGQTVVSNYTMPGNGYTPNTTSIQIPFQQLTTTNNQLRLLVAPDAKTLFWLYSLQVVQSN